MSDYGYVDVSTECPIGACEGITPVRVFGQHNGDYYRTVKCSTCGLYYGVKIALTVEGDVTEYTLEEPI